MCFQDLNLPQHSITLGNMAVSKTRENYKKRLVGALYARCASLPSDVRGLGLAANGQAASTHAVPGSQRARCARQPARAVPGSQRARCARQAAGARTGWHAGPRARCAQAATGRARTLPGQHRPSARCLAAIGQQGRWARQHVHARNGPKTAKLKISPSKPQFCPHNVYIII